MIIEFALSIEVDDEEVLDSDEQILEEFNKEFDSMLSSMEEVIGKPRHSLNDSEWQEI
jgi:hypothetical protein